MDTANEPDDGDSFPSRKPESDCDVIAALIKRCEQSLETLVVRRMFPMEKTEQRLSLSSQDINLRSLRTLNLSDCAEVDQTASRVMLCPSLRHLSMPWKWDESFLSCETLRNLETLVIPYLKDTPRKPSTVGPMMKFLNRHPHIKKLCLGLGTDAFIDKRLLPCLSNGNWANLNSLSLTWDGPGMEESTRPHIARVSRPALAAIGSLDSLEQLSLTAGVTSGWRRQWLIDHDAVRESLKSLTRLKRLAISRDTYSVPFDVAEPEYYYEMRIVDPEDLELAEKRSWINELEPIDVNEAHEVWEYAHRYKMFKQAEKYAEVIPTLEWVYCGEWPMDFFDGPVYEDGLWDGQTMRKVARPLARVRDSCWSYLRQTFGMGHEED
ncbi:hypothetical protein K4K49_003594 [Colletotrichum sp. SAR 10_70]|nr:hypothetical protein K4K50_002823 [Colletotrichum sp. SAR 10_71]KAI8172231.1 hypothetical protein K4K49_003594 [Colletotrichum sp. SAR 10_70]